MHYQLTYTNIKQYNIKHYQINFTVKEVYLLTGSFKWSRYALLFHLFTPQTISMAETRQTGVPDDRVMDPNEQTNLDQSQHGEK